MRLLPLVIKSLKVLGGHSPRKLKLLFEMATSQLSSEPSPRNPRRMERLKQQRRKEVRREEEIPLTMVVEVELALLLTQEETAPSGWETQLGRLEV